MSSKIGRYSKYIRPISVFYDLLIVTVLSLFFLKNLNINCTYYVIYQTLAWITIAYFIEFYDVFRFTTPIEITSKIIKQSVIFLFVIIAFFPFSKQVTFSRLAIAKFLFFSYIFIIIFKFILFFYLKKYRILTGGNFRKIVIVGYTPEAFKLKEFFEIRSDYGYKFLGYFSDKKVNSEIIGKLEFMKEFVIDHNVDEIYCSLNEISNERLKEFVDFADEKNKTIKFIPDSKEIFSKNLKIDFYEMFPVLSMQKTVLHDPTTKFFKRIFDFFFALLIIVLILSWLVPILALLIKLESKGPLFFKQSRPGINEKEFFCYKFRSMQINQTTETEASKNDPRVTRMGRFLRKTSIDETPQFLNVLFGDMSVVGPRPHLWSQNKTYGNRVKKYMVRHYVKPGITGLAQVKGYRGEIETDDDMIKRIKYDVFYIENWSFLLDLKIIVLTVFNIFKGEDKAY
jgi:putative colanic acid biosysnthesis UDP-glucose lipid carrier transferase